MLIKELENIDKQADRWVINYDSSLGKKIYIDFTYLPNNWFKQTQKEIFIECLTIGQIEFTTIYTYHNKLKRFFEFIHEYGINLNTFADFTYQHAQMYIGYLKQQGLSNSTMGGDISALKWIVLHGQNFEYDGFPLDQVFDGDEYRAVRVEDALKTKYIPDEVMEQIKRALRNEKNLMLKSIIEIGIDTGLRLGEVLDLKVGCLTEDFLGKPVLHVVSKKNNTERYIPVTRRVKKAISTLEKISEEARNALDTKYLTVYWMKRGRPKRYDRLTQPNFRSQLRYFVKRHKILDTNKNQYQLKFHGFRHTLGTEMINKGMGLTEIANYLGHESLHSTSDYAKVKNPIIQKEYKKLGFVGRIVKDISEKSLNYNIDEKNLKVAALPDGACSQPINNKGNICANYNMCIICPKFITTPDHLSVHKNHLNRLQADKELYMKYEYIGTFEHLNTIESTLKEIIQRLEEKQYD